MRKIVISILSTVSVLVLVFSFDASRRGGDVVTTAVAPSGAPRTSQDSPTATATGVSGTFTGDEAQTRWGVVQVQIVVKNGKIAKATAVQYPQENGRDLEINSWAIPRLEQDTVASNGQVDGYSGATVTSEGYRESLQSAMDQARL